MRRILESEAARRAATHIDRVVLKILRQAVIDIGKRPGKADWVARWTEFNDLFHKTIAEAGAWRRT